jgi:hypothetical protein
MDRRLNWIVVALMLVAVAGCSKSDPAGSTATSASVPNDPAAQAAYDFLDAVLKGDTQRASNRLTPTARQKISESGKRFAPPGLESATLRIGQVKMPVENRAIVQGFLSDKQPDGTDRTEEIGCILRFVDGQWLVAGLAYVPAPNRPFVVLDFENPQQGAVAPQPPMVQAPGQTPAGVTTRPSPETAQQQVEQTGTYR